jgi:hypothetical protein
MRNPLRMGRYVGLMAADSDGHSQRFEYEEKT